MSDTNTATETQRPDSTETDWIANCSQGYGVGYTERQALKEMVAQCRDPETLGSVTLVEHVGEAKISPARVDIDGTVVQEKVIDFSDAGETAKELREAVMATEPPLEQLLETGETVDTYDAFAEE